MVMAMNLLCSGFFIIMEDKRKIGLAIPTYNREDLLYKSFEYLLADKRVITINISDDNSDIDLFTRVSSWLAYSEKITMTRNSENIGCFMNKRNAAIGVNGKCQDWIILMDSDNVFGVDYLDRLYEIDKWEPDTIYTPCFAAPSFDFRAYSGLTISKENVAEYIDRPLFQTMLNACNYFVNRNSYLALDIWNGIDPVTSDSIFVCLKWLEAGNKIKVVEGLQYFHRVHEGSHYQNNISRTPAGFHESILNQLRDLK